MALTDNLVSYLKFDGDLLDSVGSTNATNANATYELSTRLITNKTLNNLTTLPNILKTDHIWSFSLWFRNDSIITNPHFNYIARNDSDEKGFQLYYAVGSSPLTILCPQYGYTYTLKEGVDHDYHNVILVFISNNLHIFFDSVKIGSMPYSSTGDNILFGYDSTGTNNNLGTLSEVRYYDTTLTGYDVANGQIAVGEIEDIFLLGEDPIIEQCATPIANPTSKTSDEEVFITLTCETYGALMYYTTDGEIPTSASIPYSGNITLTESTTLKAIAILENYEDSEIMTEIYEINIGGNEMLKDIEVNIYDQSQGITQAGFGLPLIFSPICDFAYAEITTAAAAAAILDTTTAAVIDDQVFLDMVSAVFAQSPSVTTVAVYGKRLCRTGTGKGTAAGGTSTTIILESTSGATDGDIIYLYDGIGKGKWRTQDGALSTVTATVTTAFGTAAGVDIPTTATKYAIFDDTAIEAAVELAINDLIRAGHNDWYWLLTTARAGGCETISNPIVDACLDLATDNKKYFVTAFEDNGTAGYTAADTEAVTFSNANNSERLTVIATDQFYDFPDAALVGKIATYTPGTYTAKFKTLAGVDTTAYTDTEITTMHTGNVITVTTKYGRVITSEGFNTFGAESSATDGKKYLDTTIVKDYMQARIEEAFALAFFNAPKISYDGKGLAKINAILESTFSGFVSDGIIAVDDAGSPLYKITVPALSSISTALKANRKLEGVTFEATLSGAIHKVTITGYIVL